MKTTELRDIEDDKLREHIATARRDLFGLRMQHATGELDNSARLRSVKRDLARALTVARQRGVDPNSNTPRRPRSVAGDEGR
jgi:large subunit ribosomal protein L29